MTFRAIPSGRTYPSTPARSRYIPARSAACSAWYSWNPPRQRCSTQSVLNKVKTATSSSKTFVLKNSPKDAEAAYLSTAGNKIKIGTAEYTVASFDAATNTVTLSDNATLTADAIVYSEDAGSIDGTTKAGADVHSTLIFGKDAYGIVDVGGSGALQIIIKPHGSAGTSDPLDQRATVGAKVAAYAAKILNELWIIRIEHGVSA